MTPFRGLTRDQNLRPDIDLEKIGTLKPVFERGSRGTLTAANSTPLTDGASVVLLASEEWAKARGLPILAYFKDGEAAAVNFVDRQEGLLMAPVYAVPRLLAQRPEPAGLRLLRDPRGLRRPGALHPEGLGRPRVLQDPSRPRPAAGLHRPQQAQRQGSSLAAGRSPPREDGSSPTWPSCSRWRSRDAG